MSRDLSNGGATTITTIYAFLIAQSVSLIKKSVALEPSIPRTDLNEFLRLSVVPKYGFLIVLKLLAPTCDQIA